MVIKKKDIVALSENIRKIIDGQDVDLRDNREGPLSILKNDIHTLASMKREQVDILEDETALMRSTMENISHQLKTPLTSMLIMADLLEDAPKDKQAEFLSNIKRELLHVDWLVSTLLKMAKLDANAVFFTLEDVTANTLLEQALEPLQILREVREQHIELSGNLALIFHCDIPWTKEALTNVIKNAMEHSPPQSIIRIVVDENPICKWIAITDSGEGIPRTKIKSLFRRFSGERSKKGYGIGLPLALAIMHGLGGDIEVNGGGNGRGATFVLKFYRMLTDPIDKSRGF